MHVHRSCVPTMLVMDVSSMSYAVQQLQHTYRQEEVSEALDDSVVSLCCNACNFITLDRR